MANENEILTEVKTFKVELKCEKCNAGTMESCKSMVENSDPLLYIHKCTNPACDAELQLPNPPYPTYRRVEQPAI